MRNSLRQRQLAIEMVEILSHDNECIEWNNQEIQLSMYVKNVRFDTKRGLRYSEFFTMLHNAISDDFKRQVEIGENK